MVKCASCVCLCMSVSAYSYTQDGLNYRPKHWPALYHLDLCYFMLHKICLIKGLMVVKSEVILTFEPNAQSHTQAAVRSPGMLGSNDAFFSPPSSCRVLQSWRASANHLKVSFISFYMFDIKRSKFLRYGMLQTKSLMKQNSAVSFYKDKQARMKFILNKSLLK